MLAEVQISPPIACWQMSLDFVATQNWSFLSENRLPDVERCLHRLQGHHHRENLAGNWHFLNGGFSVQYRPAAYRMWGE